MSLNPEAGKESFLPASFCHQKNDLKLLVYFGTAFFCPAFKHRTWSLHRGWGQEEWTREYHLESES